MKIKISLLRSILHVRDSFTQNNEKFLKNIESKLGVKLEIAPIEDYDCDLKLIFIESGGSEGLFLNNIKVLKEPYYLLTSGENNSLAASLEILTYLNLNNLKGEVIHGDIDYISNRIKNLTNSSYKKMINRRLGVIGQPSDWLISSIPDCSAIKEKFNYDVIDISITKLEDEFSKINSNEFNENIDLDFDKFELDKAKKVYIALNKIKDEYKLDGLTIRCFDLLNSIKSTSCLGLGLLNKNGTIGTCEGDIMSMVSMQFIKDVTGKSSFQANPSRIDATKNEIIFAHCTIPFDMINDYKLMTHFESNTGVAIKGELDCRDVTILRISSNLKDYFVSEGKIIENLNEPNLCRTQIRVKLVDDVKKLLTKPCGNHHIIVYGKHKKDLESLLETILASC